MECPNKSARKTLIDWIDREVARHGLNTEPTMLVRAIRDTTTKGISEMRLLIEFPFPMN